MSGSIIADPFVMFRNWFAEAQQSEPSDPNAMTLATCSPAGCPASRIVLLKDWDAAGFVFYTNVESRKGNELATNPRAALLFHWKPQGQTNPDAVAREARGHASRQLHALLEIVVVVEILDVGPQPPADGEPQAGVAGVRRERTRAAGLHQLAR